MMHWRRTWSLQFFICNICFTIKVVSQERVESVSASLGRPALLHCELEFPGGLVQPYTVHWHKQGQAKPVYLWRERSPPIVGHGFEGRVSLAGPASLNISSVQASDLGWYECRVFVQSTRADDTLQRNGSWVHLEVEDPGLHFIEEPESIVLLPGDRAVLRCSTWPPTQLKWRVHGQYVQFGQDPDVQLESGHLVLQYRVGHHRHHPPLDGFYQCVAVLGDLALSSRPARVAVAVLHPFKDQQDVVLKVPQSSVAVIPCPVPVSIPAGIVRLERDNGTIVLISERIQRLQSGNFKILNVNKNDEGSYRCSIENSVVRRKETSHHTIKLVVIDPTGPLGPQLIASPQQSSYAVSFRGNLTLECVASGIPPPKVTWIRYGGELPQGRHTQNAGKLFLTNLQKGDEGTYVCQAENGFGHIASAHAIVDIQEKPSFVRSLQTQNQTIEEGSEVILECPTSGVPRPLLTWVHNANTLEANDHITIRDSRLVLRRITTESSGLYQCFATNELGTVYSTARLRVMPRRPLGVDDSDSTNSVTVWSSRPTITFPPSNLTSLPGMTVVLPCLLDPAAGAMQAWLRSHRAIVFEREPRFDRAPSGALRISRVEPSDSGLYTCVAVGMHGYSSASAYLNIMDAFNKSSIGEKNTTFSQPNIIPGQTHSAGRDSDVLHRPQPEHTHNKWKHRHHNKTTKQRNQLHISSNGKAMMVPPTRPQVTKLSDESVMVRWDVPANDGLTITFFKVQYKDVSKSNSRWMTIDDEIAPHIHSFEVPNLKTGHTYRFRIAAVYSNNDNKQGPNSAKFHLQKDPPMKKPIIGPTIVHAEAVSSSAIKLSWQHMDIDMVPIEGFFVYYRSTTSAGDYSKVTVIGANTRSHIINHLLPDVAYDFKMQCFNVAGTSEFSSIYTQKTLSSGNYNPADQDVQMQDVNPVSTSHNSNSSDHLSMILGIVLGCMVLILVAFMIFCGWKQRQQRQQFRAAMDKSNNCHELVPAINGKISTNGHTHIGNGHLPMHQMTISVNPLAQNDRRNCQIPVTETSLSQDSSLDDWNRIKRLRKTSLPAEGGDMEAPERKSLLGPPLNSAEATEQNDSSIMDTTRQTDLSTTMKENDLGQDSDNSESDSEK